MADDKPTAAFVLSLIGGILELIGAIYMAALGAALAMFTGGLTLVCGVWFIIAAIFIILGAVWQNTGEPDKVKNGSLLVIIFSILGGINIISLIGGILGYTWNKKNTFSPPPPPPM
jgi:hypothetical protein